MVKLALGFETQVICLNGHEFSSIKPLFDFADTNISMSMNPLEYHFDSRPSETISSYSQQLKNFFIKGTLIVLLPADTKKHEVQSTMQMLRATVEFESDTKFQIYPYGNASFLLALSHIERATKQNDCWILAIQPATNQAPTKLNNGALILARAFPCDTGLECLPARVDLANSTNQSAIDKVVSQLSFRSSSLFTSLSLSLDANEPLWLNSIKYLAPWITEATNYEFLDAKLSSLGVCGGLLKAINAFEKQIRQPEKGFHQLQLDIEPRGYVVGTTYTWV